MTRLLMALVVALVALAAPPARAEGDAGQVLVHVTGPGQAPVQRAISRAIEGQKVQVLAARGGRDSLEREARRRGAQVIVDARLRGRRRITLVVTVRDLAGETLQRARFRERNRRRLLRRVRRDLWDEIGGAVTEAARAAEPAVAEAEPEDEGAGEGEAEAAPAATEVAEAAPASADDDPSADDDAELDADAGLRAAAEPGAAADASLALSAQAAFLSRRYAYVDDVYDELRGYSVAMRPGVGVAARWHPAAQLGVEGALSHLGIAASYLYLPSFQTVTADGRRYDTTANAFAVGLRWRQKLGGLDLDLVADYAGRRFTMARGDLLRGPAVPDVLYRVARVGVAAETRVGSWTVGAAAAYRHVLETGEVTESMEYFPRATVRGVDAELHLARPIAGGFDLRAAAAFEQYGYALHPEPGDPKIAGGAADQYLTLSLGLVYAL